MATCAHVYINEPVARLSVSIHFTLLKKYFNKSRPLIIDLSLLHVKKLLALFWKKNPKKLDIHTKFSTLGEANVNNLPSRQSGLVAASDP